MATEENDVEQELNTAKLVISAFYKVSREKEGASADDITQFLQSKFGDIWKVATLKEKIENTLHRSAVLGFLYRTGDRYMKDLAREMSYSRRRQSRRKRKRLTKPGALRKSPRNRKHLSKYR